MGCVILKVMKKFFEKLQQSKVFWVALIIVIQTIVYVAAGIGKNYFHMDEMYSYGLANFDQVQIYEKDDFYNKWHNAAYYKDYIVVNEDEKGDFSAVYNNQRDDVHPPLYYLLLRIGMELTPGEFSKWTGIVINIVAFAVNTTFLFLVVDKLLGKERSHLTKSFVLTLAVSLTVATISTVMYIRMYAMLTMWVTITMYLHMRLWESKKTSPGLLVALGLTALMGVLTQYYYLFFLAPLFVVLAVKYWKAKRWAELRAYVGTLVGAAVVSLVIWPYSIQHLFFGYRGQGAMGNLLNFANLGAQVGIFAGILVLYDFHYMLPFLLIAMFALAIVGLKRRKALTNDKEQDDYYGMMLWPSLFFFVVVSIASPFTDLRYLEAICGLMFVVVIYGLYKLVGMFAQEKTRSIIMAVILVVMALLPIPLKIEPDVEYSRFAALNEFVDEHKELPLLYMYNPGNERFLDDLPVFAEVDESYVMHHQDYTPANFRKVLAGKDLGGGLMVFANYGNENEHYLKVLRETMGLEQQQHIFHTNSADLYLLTKK